MKRVECLFLFLPLVPLTSFFSPHYLAAFDESMLHIETSNVPGGNCARGSAVTTMRRKKRI